MYELVPGVRARAGRHPHVGEANARDFGVRRARALSARTRTHPRRRPRPRQLPRPHSQRPVICARVGCHARAMGPRRPRKSRSKPAHLRGADTRGQGSRRSPRRTSQGERSAQTRSGGWRRRPKGGRGAASSDPRQRVHSCSMPTEPRATEPKRSRAARAAHDRTRLTAAGVARSTPRGARIGPDRHREPCP